MTHHNKRKKAPRVSFGPSETVSKRHDFRSTIGPTQGQGSPTSFRGAHGAASVALSPSTSQAHAVKRGKRGYITRYSTTLSRHFIKPRYSRGKSRGGSPRVELGRPR